MEWLSRCWYEEKSCKDRGCPYYEGEHSLRTGACERALHLDALALMKEQQNQIWEMQDRAEYLEDKLKEQPQIVRCKDCKHHKKDTCSADAGMAFPPPDDWFCADGERKDS